MALVLAATLPLKLAQAGAQAGARLFSRQIDAKRRRIQRSITPARQKAAATALPDNEHAFRTLADVIPQLVWSARPDGHIDYANARFHAFTGVPDGTPLGERWAEFVHPDDRPAMQAARAKAQRNGEPYEMECRFRRHDGAYLWVLMRVTPLRDSVTGALVRWFGTNTDIAGIVAARETMTQNRVALEALIDVRTEALHDSERRRVHAERIGALGQLAGGIAHDFNNVLQAVQGCGALIARRFNDPEQVARLSAIILRATEQGAAITHRLLAFSRQSDPRAEVLDADALLVSMREILVHTLGAGIDIRIAITTGLPPLIADRGQLETVLVNLCTNARDAMAGRGTLTLSATETVWPDNANPDYPLALNAGRYICLSVTDTGCGMDAATLARVTEPFFTTKPGGEGTGLGLAMAQGFADQSAGALDIGSIQGEGTSVTLFLPVLAEAAPRGKVDDSRPQALKVPKARVMLVDDDPFVREVLTEQLQVAGLIVSAFASGAAALAHLAQGGLSDVLVTDLTMSGMDGVNLIREAQGLRAGLPAVLITGHMVDATRIALDGALTGAFTLLRKPIDGPLLVERLETMLGEVSPSC